MNRRGIVAVVRRDLTVTLGSKAVVVPAVVVPAMLAIVLPLLAGAAPRLVSFTSAGDLEPLLRALPAQVVDRLPDDPGLLVAEVAVTYLLAPMVLLVPVLVASVVAADGIAGEKERRTLEGLLLTPLSDRDIALAKLLAAWVPAVALGIGGGVVYAVMADLAVGTQVGRLVLPTPAYLVMVVWVGPALAAAALGAVSLVSARVTTTQEAFQIGGVVVVPVVGLVVAQASGVLLLSVWLLVIAGVVGFLAALGLVVAASRALARPRLGPHLG